MNKNTDHTSNPNKLPQCNTCVYFEHLSLAFGNCHLNPPIPLTTPNEGLHLSELPTTWEVNYCSHHKAKENTN